MEPEALVDHIARLDAEATDQEALVRALEPYSDPPGTTTVAEIATRLRPTDPARAQSLLCWTQSLVARGSSIASRTTHTLVFRHNELSHIRPALERSNREPLAKMISGTQAFVTGSHSVDEDRDIADLRAGLVAAHLRAYLPPSRTVTVKPHVCSAACQEAGDRIHRARVVEVAIYTRAEMLQVGPMRHAAESTRRAHRAYLELAAGRPKAVEPCPIRPPAKIVALDAALEEPRARTRELWRQLEPYREQFKYDSIGTLVDYLEKVDHDKSLRIIDQLERLIADLMTPSTLAIVTVETVKFVPQTAELEDGQQKTLVDLLSEMNERDGGTSVVFSGWHEKDEDTELADRRGQQLLQYFRPRAHPHVRLATEPHVCGRHCSRLGIQLLRRVGWVRISWRPRNVMIEDIRIAAVDGTF